MNKFLSKKIKYTSFFTMFFVIFIHAYNYADTFLQPDTLITEGANYSAMLQFWISNGISRFANPLFFATSGYLLFIKLDATFESYENNLLKRCRTIVLPFLIWVGLWTIVGFIMYFNNVKLPIIDEKIGALLKSPWAFITTPLPFQFWYLVDLIKLVVISPLIYVMNKRLKGYPIIFFAILWALDISYVINADGILFFSIGAYFAINKKAQNLLLQKSKSKMLTVMLLLILLAVSAIYTYLAAFWKDIYSPTIVRVILYRATQLLALIVFWRLFDFAGNEKETLFEKRIISCSFFIYALHEPTQHFIFQSIVDANTSDAVHQLLYFSVPLLICIIAYIIANLTKSLSVKLYGILTGGRIN